MFPTNICIIGLNVTTLAAGVFLCLELFGVRWSPRVQWVVGLSLIAVFLWFLGCLADTVSV